MKTPDNSSSKSGFVEENLTHTGPYWTLMQIWRRGLLSRMLFLLNMAVLGGVLLAGAVKFGDLEGVLIICTLVLSSISVSLFFTQSILNMNHHIERLIKQTWRNSRAYPLGSIDHWVGGIGESKLFETAMALDNSAVGMIKINGDMDDFKYIYANTNYLTLFAATLEDLAEDKRGGRDFVEWRVDRSERDYSLIGGVILNDEDVDAVVEMKNQNDRHFHHYRFQATKVKTHSHKDDGEHVIIIVLTPYDNTVQVQEFRKQTHSIIQNFQDAYGATTISLNPITGDIINSDNKFYSLIGVEALDRLAINITDHLLHTSTRRPINIDEIWDIYRRGETMVPCILKHQSGTIINIRMNIIVLFDNNANIDHLYLAFIDQSPARAAAEIKRNIAMGNHIESMSHMVGTVLHDIRNSLAPAANFTELLSLQVEAKASHDDIINTADRINHCIDNSLESLTSLNILIPEEDQIIEHIDIGHSLTAIIQKSYALFDNAQRLQQRTTAHRVYVETSAIRFERLILTLISIISEFMPTESHLEISSKRLTIQADHNDDERGDDRTALRLFRDVKYFDDETGIETSSGRVEAGDYVKIQFQFSASTDKNSLIPQLLALGKIAADSPNMDALEPDNIVFGIKAILGYIYDEEGYISVRLERPTYSEAMARAQVSIFIKVSHHDQETAGEEDEGSGSHHIRQTPHIAIIDDNIAAARAIGDILSHHNIAHDIFDTPDALFRAIKAHQYNLILSDYIIPGMNGGQIAQRLHNQGDMTPVIIISGHLDRIPKELPENIKSVEQKPVRQNRLLDLINTYSL